MSDDGAVAERLLKARTLDFLLNLQEQTYAHLDLPVPRTYEAKAVISRISAELAAEMFRSLPVDARADRAEKMMLSVLENTHARKYEDPMLLSLMHSLAEQIESACQSIGLKIPRRPTLGTLPAGQVTAMTILVPGTEDHLVLFEPRLFTFALLLSKAVAQAFPTREEIGEELFFSVSAAEVEQWINSDGRALGHFQDVLFSYVFEGDPNRAPQYIPEGPYIYFADLIRASMELFVLGHEYAHIGMGHLEEYEAPLEIERSLEDADIPYSWMQELTADLVGVRLSAEAMASSRNADFAFATIGAEFYFSAIDVMDQAVSLLLKNDSGELQLGSHPPVEDRKRFLRHMLGDMATEEDVESAVMMADAVDHALTYLWKETEPVLRKLRDHGASPAPMWMQRLVRKTDV